MISFLHGDDETPEDAIVVIKEPRLEGDSITCTVQLLEGGLPAKAESCSVFIDPSGGRRAEGSAASPIHTSQPVS